MSASPEPRDERPPAAERLRDVTGTLWQPPLGVVLRPFRIFAQLSAAGGILLGFGTVLALAWANSPWSDAYDRLWGTYVTVGGGDLVIRETLGHWVNDGLMALFFFVVGLEIKREVLIGELASPRRGQRRPSPRPWAAWRRRRSSTSHATARETGRRAGASRWRPTSPSPSACWRSWACGCPRRSRSF